jgi:hypothetical protein
MWLAPNTGETMKERIANDNVSGVPEQKTQDSPKGLKNDEVRNLNNEAQQAAPSDEEDIDRLMEGVASRTLPTNSEDDGRDPALSKRILGTARETSVAEVSIQHYKDAVREAVECDYIEFLHSTSVGGWKYWSYAGHLARRLGLTEDQKRQAQKEVLDEYGKTTDPSAWNIFLNGSSEERRALQDSIAWEMYGDPDQFEKTGRASSADAARYEQPIQLGKEDASANQSKDPTPTNNERVGDRQENGVSRNNTHDVRNVDGEGQMAVSSKMEEPDHASGKGLVDPMTVAQSICRAVVEPIAKVLEMSEPDGFCWISMSREVLTAAVTSFSETPVNIKVPILLVLFDGRRIESNEELPIQIQVSRQQIKVTQVDSKVMAIRVSRTKVRPEDTLETLGNALRSGGCADSDIFIHVTVHGDRYEVTGWVTGSEAKAYRGSHAVDKPAAA